MREKHSVTIYEIEYSGFFNKLETTLTSDYKILQINESKNGGTLSVEVLNEQMTSNDLLKRMMQHGTISSFQKNLPSMNDIFIKVVGDTNSVTE